MQPSERIALVSILLLGIFAFCIWYAVALEESSHMLRVSFLDVGQGDAIFIESPSGKQILIDGGLGTEVLRELSAQMPWYDRALDLVVGTHPDMDHIGGLIGVLDRFRVRLMLLPTTDGSTSAWNAYQTRVDEEIVRGALAVEAIRGQILDIGGGAYIEVLFPDRALPHVDANTGCIIARVVYGATAFMLSCDAPDEIERYLVNLDPNSVTADVLKAGHHGSKTSSSEIFIDAVSPRFVVYSRGCDNSYGHPAPEVVARYSERNIEAFDTCTDSTITFESDGRTVFAPQ
jgi:competence protein ComEC